MSEHFQIECSTMEWNFILIILDWNIAFQIGTLTFDFGPFHSRILQHSRIGFHSVDSRLKQSIRNDNFPFLMLQH